MSETESYALGYLKAESLTPAQFRDFAQLAHRRCGLKIEEGKEQMVATRLRKVMRARGMTSFAEYYRLVTADGSGRVLEELLDALTTNHTSFFREPAHFDFLREKLSAALASRPVMRIWSAACSTGEEPYSIAMTLLDALGPLCLGRIHLLATDISTRVLSRAQRGFYEGDCLGSLQYEYLRRYFLRGEGQWSNWYLVKKAVRERIAFERFNLVEGFAQHEKFPVIFCRNVMIYFDGETRQEVVRNLSNCLEPGGYLFVGHSESLNSIRHELHFVAPAIYRKAGVLRTGS